MSRRWAHARVSGRVVAYDAAAGYGAVTDDATEWFFHCSSIADGSRKIPVGTAVDFVLVPGHRGRMEARDVRPA